MFLLVASLLLVSPPSAPSGARSTSPTPRPFADVLVQGDGAAAAVAAAGGRLLAALPIVGGLLARVPEDRAGELSSHPGVRAVTDADRPLQASGPPTTPPGVWTARRNPRPVRLASPSGGPRFRRRG